MIQRSAFRFISFVVYSILILAAPALLRSQSIPVKPEDLTRESDLIVVGHVGGLTPEWTPKKDRIQTRVLVSIDQMIKGNTEESSITVIIPGGEIDGVGEWYSHSVRFENTEDVVLFAKKSNNGEYRVTGGESGKFSVKKDPQTGLKFIPNIGSVQQFATKIKSVMKLQDTQK